MAKNDTGKIRVIMFEMEGNNETLQEGMRTIAQALARQTGAQRVLPAASTSAGNGHSLPASQSQTTLDFVEEVPEEAVAALPTTKKGHKRKYYSPKVLDIDLNSGDMPLEEYCKTKNPTTTIDKYLVIADWLKQYRDIDVLSTDHMYTCFKKMNWGVQKDMAQPLRAAKSSGYMDSAGHGGYKLNHIGEDKVRKMGGGG